MCLIFLDAYGVLMKLPVVDRAHPQSNTLCMGMENKANGDLKFDNSPVLSLVVPSFSRFHIKKVWSYILAVLFFSESCWLPMERHFMKRTEMVKQHVIVQ